VALGLGLVLLLATAAAPAVPTVTPTQETISERISTTAIVTPRNRLEVRPPVAGRLETLLVQEGERVKKGQPLATMSSTDRATLMDAAFGKGEEEVKYWQEVYKPIQLVAPMDAVVIVATLQPGQVVATTDPIVVLSDQLIVRSQVDETDISRIRLGQQATVQLDAFPTAPIQAAVEHIYYESVVQSNVTVYKVDLKVEQVPEFFRSGMNAQVGFDVAQKENTLVLPMAAVDFAGSTPTVTVLDEKGKEKRVEVKTGIVSNDKVEIVSGLEANSRVVVKNSNLNLQGDTGGKNPFMPQFRRSGK